MKFSLTDIEGTARQTNAKADAVSRDIFVRSKTVELTIGENVDVRSSGDCQ